MSLTVYFFTVYFLNNSDNFITFEIILIIVLFHVQVGIILWGRFYTHWTSLHWTTLIKCVAICIDNVQADFMMEECDVPVMGSCSTAQIFVTFCINCIKCFHYIITRDIMHLYFLRGAPVPVLAWLVPLGKIEKIEKNAPQLFFI